MEFKSFWFLFAVPFVLFALIWIKRRQKAPTLRFPSSTLVDSIKPSLRSRLSQTPFLLRLLAATLFIIALAGPRSVLEEIQIYSEGVDIVLAIDASGSMAAEDFTDDKGGRTNRLEVVKNVVGKFIENRHYDRIGLIAFGDLAYTVSPLTTDYAWLRTNLERIELGTVGSRTAIGSAIGSALARLRKSEAQSKIIILLTDGRNNVIDVDPVEAARAAKALDVKIYTIGAGTKGVAPVPVMDIFGRRVYRNQKVDIDEATLTQIAEITGGEYFRATDTESLKDIYNEIDRMEKTKIEEVGYKTYKELFVYVLGAALFILLIEQILLNTVFIRIP